MAQINRAALDPIVRELVNQQLARCHRAPGASHIPISGSEATWIVVYLVLVFIAFIFTMSQIYTQKPKDKLSRPPMRSISTQTEPLDTTNPEEPEWTSVDPPAAEVSPPPSSESPTFDKIFLGLMGLASHVALIVLMTRSGVKIVAVNGGYFYAVVILLLTVAELLAGISIHTISESYSQACTDMKGPAKRTNFNRMFELVIISAIAALVWPLYALWVG